METHTLIRGTWAEIDLDCLGHNMRETRKLVPETAQITAVVKANGYGHGAAAIGQTFLENGADRFAVATLSEALALRPHFPKTDILILGHVPDGGLAELIAADVIPTIFDLRQAKILSAEAMRQKKTVRLHVKIDSGMHRLGFACGAESVETILRISKLEGLFLEGVFTHFAKADEADKTITYMQADRFKKMVADLKDAGLSIPIVHAANSAAIIDCPEYSLDMVRAGIMLYGLYPSDAVNKSRIELKSAMTLKASIAQVREIEYGEGVSYGLRFKAEKKMQIATLPIGYADGFSRRLSGLAMGAIKGVNRPIIGTICMDQCILSLDGIKASPGEVVTLFGGLGPSIDQYAEWLGTINYEVVCMVRNRVPRIYLKKAR